MSIHDKHIDPAWLREAVNDRLELTGVNVWKALRHSAHIQVIGHKGEILDGVKNLKEVARFRVTQRGYDLLEGKEPNVGAELFFNPADPPLNIRLWLSAFRRWMRNCPEGLHLAYSDGELRVLAEDKSGKVKDDAGHLVKALKVRSLRG